ncbi:hypothetical protein D3C86_1147240 [compost metagenome]
MPSEIVGAGFVHSVQEVCVQGFILIARNTLYHHVGKVQRIVLCIISPYIGLYQAPGAGSNPQVINNGSIIRFHEVQVGEIVEKLRS